MSGKAFTAVGLDVGSGRTRCLVCIVDNGQIRYAGHGEVESQGWTKGQISDQNALTTCVMAAFAEAERISGISIESATVGIGGPHSRGSNRRAAMPLGRPREIEAGDVKRLVEEASRVQLQEDRMVLQVFPQ